jgi:hypothetical protein
VIEAVDGALQFVLASPREDDEPARQQLAAGLEAQPAIGTGDERDRGVVPAHLRISVSGVSTSLVGQVQKRHCT